MPLPANIDYRKLVEDSNLFKVDNPAKYYDIVKQVGTGGYGKIYLVQKKEDQTFYALKFINKQRVAGLTQQQPTQSNNEEAGGASPPIPAHQETIRNEIALMSICDHENIVKYHDGYYFKDRFWIFIEYMDAGCLTDILEVGFY